MDQFLPATILMMILAWYTSYFVSYSDFDAKQQAVNTITYNYTQLAAKKGQFTGGMKDELISKLSPYGDYEVYVWAEKDGSSSYLEGTSVIGADLREGDYDFVNVYVNSTKAHSLTFFYKTAIFGNTGSSIEMKVSSKASSYIQ